MTAEFSKLYTDLRTGRGTQFFFLYFRMSKFDKLLEIYKYEVGIEAGERLTCNFKVRKINKSIRTLTHNVIFDTLMRASYSNEAFV